MLREWLLFVLLFLSRPSLSKADDEVYEEAVNSGSEIALNSASEPGSDESNDEPSWSEKIFDKILSKYSDRNKFIKIDEEGRDRQRKMAENKSRNENFFFRLFDRQRESAIYDLNKEEIQKGMIVFVNGVLTEAADAKDHAEYLSKLMAKKNVYYVHNATHGMILDILDCVVGKIELSQKPIELIQKIWRDFLQKDPENSILMICHSQGATLVKNALLDMRWEVRKRIIVVSIAGACIIPDSICQKAFNYISTHDFIPFFDLHSWKHDLQEIYYLSPGENANFWDHDFQSPTYFEMLKYHIDKYIDNPKWCFD
jgi:hypothetical protein